MKVIYDRHKNLTTDPKKLLDRILTIASAELSQLLGKTARNCPLENDEVKKLLSLNTVVTGAITTQIAMEKHEAAIEEEPKSIQITPEQLKLLTVKAREK